MDLSCDARVSTPRRWSRRWWKWAVLAAVALPLLLQIGCAGPVRGLFPPAAGEPTRMVYVIRHGWHTGIAVRRADVPETVLPVLADFSRAEYVEFGWGEDAFYRAPHGTIGRALKAALWPSPSVLHVAGCQASLRENFPESDIVEVALSRRGWDELVEFVDRAFERDSNGHLMPLEKGLYGDSRFYRARGKFYFPKMCNQWTASGLRAAGCPITRCCAITAGNVLWQTRRFGRTIPSRVSPVALRTSADPERVTTGRAH